MRDKDGVKSALETYEKPLLRYTQRLLGNMDHARDVVQEAFLQLCRLGPPKKEGALAAWLYTVCRNKAFDHLKREKTMLPMQSHADEWVDPAPPPQQNLESREQRDQVLQQINALPDNQREVVQLKFGEGLSYKQISEITGHSVSNVGFLIHTAVSTMRRQLNQVK